MIRNVIRATVALVVFAGAVGGCGSDDEGDDGDAAGAGSSTSTSTSGDASAGAGGWEEVVPGGDCQCSDGSEYNLWVREADPAKVVLYLEDGGGCWSAATCAPDSGVYRTGVTEHPDDEGGIFDFADPRNPLADWSVVYTPYCTGDVFLGDAATEYAPGLTIQHKGYANGTAALDQLVERFPGATEVVVVGESAGSVAAPLYAGLAADRLPDARILALADGSGSFPDAPELTGPVADAWGTGDAMPDWPENADLTAERWSSFPGLFIQSGRHAPDITFARHDYAYDHVQQRFNGLLGIGSDDLLSLVDANEAQIEEAGVDLLSYIAPGDDHTALTEDEFYTEEVGGEALLDWVARLVAGEPVADVHCTDCSTG
jgi:hypothetical protein